jgi:hypothetical protein
VNNNLTLDGVMQAPSRPDEDLMPVANCIWDEAVCHVPYNNVATP